MQGCLLDGACGDALSAPVEFMMLAQIRSRYGEKGIEHLDQAYGVLGRDYRRYPDDPVHRRGTDPLNC